VLPQVGSQRRDFTPVAPNSARLAAESAANFPPHTAAITIPGESIERLVVQEREGEVREFEFSTPEAEDAPVPEADEEVPPETPEDEEAPPPPPLTGVIELTADRQEYDDQRQVITAVGNVMLRFRGALLDADRVQVNLPNRILVAEGNVALTRGDQVLRGERFEYLFVQDSGEIQNASGELFVPTAGTDLDIYTPAGTAEEPARPLSDRITSNQPLQGVRGVSGYSFAVGGTFAATPDRNIPSLPTPQAGGTVNRFRYQADRIEFEGSEAIATNVRITNDPFSPPELELRADTARFRRISPLVDEIVATRPRLVFDQSLSIPTFRNRVVIDRRERGPGLVNFGFDDDERGGLFAERTFEILSTPTVRFSLTPQYFIQRAIFEDGIINPSAFGLEARFDAIISPRTTLVASGTLTSLDLGEFEEELRASVRLRQTIGTSLPHTLNLEYSYRDRLFNGSLGFQTVRSSIGAVLTSPIIPLGQTGINLNYQAGVQNITAETDRLDLLAPIRDDDRINLTRYQGVVSLSRGFLLWQGDTLPPTASEGLRYTPTPVRPYLALNTGLTGVASAYSNGDSQETLGGTIGLVGQVGHFSRQFFDYTGFNISYRQLIRGNLSPFLFDRAADSQILSGGITQQIYGPFRLGFQTSFNLDTGEEISTDYFLEYSRRTYNIVLRYNPVQERGSINFRINDFNWEGNPGLFDETGTRPVVQGVTQ
jgi:lipopolysaccharide export system protein LptA